MADQTPPREHQYVPDQPFYPPNPPDQGWSSEQYVAQAQDQHIPAPAESFGSFGPLPDQPAALPTGYQPSQGPLSVAPPTYPPPGFAPLMYPGQFSPYAPGLPAGVASPPSKTKKPLLFPLTRRAPALLQIFGMLLYSLIMALTIMGCILTLIKIALTNSSLYTTIDHTPNVLAISITVALVLILLPAISLFSGSFFGSWRGLIVSLLSLAGGLLLAHLSEPRFGTLRSLQMTWPLLLAPSITALVVGFIYERRKYAAWWKSMLTMFLGTAILLFWLFAFLYGIDLQAGAFDGLAANAHMSTTNYMASIAVTLGCLWLIAIPLFGVIFAGIEGIIHAILAGIRQRG